MPALGLIETRGLTGAVEAADAMLKTADVRLLEKHHSGGGLVTVLVAGEVASVQAAVEAASAAVRALAGAVLVSAHVIARPDAELSRIIRCGENAQGVAGNALSEKETTAGTPESGTAAPEDCTRLGPAQLRKAGIHRLRQIAAQTPDIALSLERIAEADKKTLIEAIMHVYGHK